MNWLTGPVIGFVLEWEGQSTGPLYISGDTVLFEGVRAVAERFRIGTAILHVGRAHFAATPFVDYTFSAEDAARAARLLNARRVIPVHYQGWTHFKDGKEKIQRTFEAQGLGAMTLWLELGARTSVRV